MDSSTVRCGCGREIAKYKNLVIEERKKQIPLDVDIKRSLEHIFNDLGLEWCCRMELTASMNLSDILIDIPIEQ